MRTTTLYDPALVHHDHLVVVSDRIQPMGNRDHSSIGELSLNALLYETVRDHVHVGSGLVQNEHLVAPQQGPR